MMVLWIGLGIAAVVALTVVGFGVFEFLTEHKQDMKFHLRHLEDINKGK